MHGIVRRASTFNSERLDNIYADPHNQGVKLSLHYSDITDGGGLRRIREFLELAAGHCDLDWRKHVKTDPRYFRPTEVDALRGDASKAREKFGWAPKVSFSDLVKMMLGHDVELAEQEKTLLRAGHTFRRGASLR